MLYPREKVQTEAESGIMGKDVDKGADNDDKEEEDKVSFSRMSTTGTSTATTALTMLGPSILLLFQVTVVNLFKTLSRLQLRLIGEINALATKAEGKRRCRLSI